MICISKNVSRNAAAAGPDTHFENHWAQVYKGNKPLCYGMPLIIWPFPPVPSFLYIAIAYWHSLSLSFIHSVSNYMPDTKSLKVFENSKALSTSNVYYLAFAIVDFSEIMPSIPAFPIWLTSNSSMFSTKHQLCKFFPLVDYDFLRAYILLHFSNSRTSYNVWPMFADQYMFMSLIISWHGHSVDLIN